MGISQCTGRTGEEGNSVGKNDGLIVKHGFEVIAEFLFPDHTRLLIDECQVEEGKRFSSF